MNSAPLRAADALLAIKLCRTTVFACLISVAASYPSAVGQEQTIERFKTQELTGTYFSEGIAVGDINADGVNDIVYGPLWFEGPEFSRKHEIFPAEPQPMQRYANHFFAWVYDFDQDGFQDVFTVGFPGTPAYVYENPGKGELTTGEHWRRHEVIDWVSNESPQFSNIVGDQRPELVCTRDGFFGYATIDWDKPFSSWTFHAVSEQVAPSKFGHGLGIGDVNGDGRLDILHSRGWLQQPEQLSGRWGPHQAKFGSAGGAEIYAYDVDGDGDNDIITSEAAHDFGLSWYEQTNGSGEDRFQKHVILGDHPSDNKYGVLFSELHSVALADIDGDGLKDIVTGKTYWSHHKQSPMWDAGAVVYWFKLVRSGDSIDWVPMQIDANSGIGRQLTVADINQDGLLDVASGGMLGAHVMMHTQESVDRATYEAHLPKPYSGPRPRNISTAAVRRGPAIELDAAGRVPAAIEAENLNAKVTGGTAKAQKMGGFTGSVWSGASQLWWTGARPGDRLTIPLDVLRDAPTLELAMTCARDYAVVEVSLDGKPLAPPIDLYNSDVISTGLLQFNAPQLTQGKHELTIEIVGANKSAVKSYMVGLDFIRFLAEDQHVAAVDSIPPKSRDGRKLNLDFETGDLSDWHADGKAFTSQPIQGDTVHSRRNDMFSLHRGKYWIGGYEVAGDEPTGTLTSEKFVASHRYASFLIGGGSSDKTRVELWGASDSQPFYSARGRNAENLHRVVVDLRRVQDSEMFIRLVDESSGGWGHINFDHFRMHARRPGPITPAAVVLAPDEYPHRGLDAQAAAAAMQVPEGFFVEVCAAEPDVKQPIAMALDDRGRVWIAEAYEYPQRAKGDTGRDRILVFEDTTGDGKLDSRKVFAEGLNLVSGLEVGFGGVWVGAAPYLMFFPDADGDDKADGPAQILLDGWGYQDTHETLNAFCWGPDGWLYGCHGVFTHSKVGKPGTPDSERTPINAGVWRYHPIEHTFEVFAHGTSNPWGVDFNEHGDAFVTACVIPHLFHMIPGARYHRQGGQHFNKHTYDDIKTIADHLHYLGATPHSGNGKSDEAGGGHAHAGALIYQGGAWPEEYNGKLLMNNIHGQRLNVDSLHRHGSGYVGSHQPDFLLTGDQASQILNMRYGPDGNVTFIDWYDMQACHRREVEVHDRSNGRIYKVSYGEPRRVEVNLAEASDLELAEYCLSPNEWFVRHSRRILQERASVGEIAPTALVRLRYLSREMIDPARRLRAAWALYCCQHWQSDDFDKLLADPDQHVRGWAIRLQHQTLKASWNDADLDRLARIAAEDDSPVVRREIASLLTTLPVGQRWSIASALVAHGEDAADHNLPLLYWYAIEPLADEDADRALALALGAAPGLERLGAFMLRRVAGSGESDAVERLTSALSKTEDPALRRSFIRALRTSLVGIRRAPMPPAWPETFAQISAGSDPALALEAAALGLTFGDKAAQKQLLAAVLDPQLSTAQRTGALSALSAANPEGLLDVVIPLADAQSTAYRSAPHELRDSAIRSMASFDSQRVSEVLFKSYAEFSPSGRTAAIATLCSRAPWARELLNSIGAGQIPAQDLTADLARQLRYIDDPQLSKLLDTHWGAIRATGPEKQRLIADYKRLVADRSLAAPDTALGHAIFSKTCGRCHQLFGVGQALGPDLTGSNRTNLDYLLENIVDPSAVMAKEYQQTVIMTEDGQVVTGIVRSENQNAVVLQTAESEKAIPADEIAERKLSDQSMMPENQLQTFSEHEIRSLIAYLRSKTQTPIRATEENAASLIAPVPENWNGNPDLWTIRDDMIIGKSEGLNHNEFLVSNVTASDFRISLEIQLVGNVGNSGIQFRSMARKDGSVEGYQADVGAGWWGKLYEEHGRGLLWDTSGEAHVKNGEWNRYEIEAIGSKLKTWINGNLCVELDDPQGSADGIFAFQLHSGGPTTVRVRNLQLEIEAAQ